MRLREGKLTSKKAVSLMLIVILAVGILAACSSENGSESASNESGNSTSTTTDAAAAENTNALSSTDGTDANGTAPDEEIDAAELAAAAAATDGIDVDLTILSTTMKYSQVYNMVNSPDDYRGQIVKMEGYFAEFTDDSTGNQYFACLIPDVAACCSQGIEFIPEGEKTYPEDFPELGEDIVVTGVFDTYTEGSAMYCTLRDATFEG